MREGKEISDMKTARYNLRAEAFMVSPAATAELSTRSAKTDSELSEHSLVPIFSLELKKSGGVEEVVMSLGYSPEEDLTVEELVPYEEHGVVLRVPDALAPSNRIFVDFDGDEFLFKGLDMTKISEIVFKRSEL